MEKEGFGFYGAPDRTFGASDMASGDLRLTGSAAATSVSHIHPHNFPDIYYGGADAAIYISGQMICHPLFDVSAPCHCVSSVCLDAAPPSHLYMVGKMIC